MNTLKNKLIQAGFKLLAQSPYEDFSDPNYGYREYEKSIKEKTAQRRPLPPGFPEKLTLMTRDVKNIGLATPAKAEHFFDMTMLKKEVQQAVKEVQANPDNYLSYGDDIATYYLETIASSGFGVEGIVEFFGEENFGYQQDEDGNWFHEESPEKKHKHLRDDEWIHDAIIQSETNGFIDELAEDLNKKVKVDGLSGLYFGYIESDGSYALIANIDLPEEKKEENN